MDADLENLSRFLSGMVDQPIALTGKKEAPFTLTVVRKNDPQESWLQMLALKMQFPANRMTTMGVTLDQFALPTELQEGQAQFNLKAAVNGGEMTLAPSVNLNEEPRFTVGRGMVLKNVRITQSMVDELLTKLHPIFVGATAGQGAVDLYLEKLDWSLTDKMKLPLACDGQLILNQVALKSVRIT